jgi:hypothetical protein
MNLFTKVTVIEREAIHLSNMADKRLTWTTIQRLTMINNVQYFIAVLMLKIFLTSVFAKMWMSRVQIKNPVPEICISLALCRVIQDLLSYNFCEAVL